MTGPSHATLATFRMDLSREAEQRAGLEEMIVPGVRRHPVFVAGTWTLDRAQGTSFIMLTYDSVDAAESMKENILANAEVQRAVGIALVSVRVLELSATAAREV